MEDYLVKVWCVGQLVGEWWCSHAAAVRKAQAYRKEHDHTVRVWFLDADGRLRPVKALP